MRIVNNVLSIFRKGRNAALCLGAFIMLAFHPLPVAAQGVNTQCEPEPAVWDALGLKEKIDKFLVCDNLTIKTNIPGTDFTLFAFYANQLKDEKTVWHFAILAGDQTLNDNPLAKMPALQPIIGGLKINSMLTIISKGEATIDLEHLDPQISAILADYQDASAVPDTFGDFKADDGSVTLHQGANLFGSFKGPKTASSLGLLSELALPGSTSASGDWKYGAVLGKNFVKELLKNVPEFKDIEVPEPTGERAFGLNLWLPTYAPFPFNLINDKKTFHVELQKAHFAFDVSKSDTGGKINMSAESWNHYWIFSDKNPIPIHASGDLVLENNQASGAVTGVYEVQPSTDPFGFIPGVNLTKLMIGGAIDTNQDAKAKEMHFKTASEIKLGGEALTSTLDVIIEKQGADKVRLKEVRISLAGASGDGTIEIGKMAGLNKIPLANELVLEKGVIGVIPLKKGFPDFYISGGVTWTRTNQGGKLAILKRTPKGGKEELFIFVTQNDFTLANLLPKTKDFDVPRTILTAMKMPKTMMMFTSMKKDGELEVADLPEPVQPLFEGMVAGVADAQGRFEIDPDAQPLRIYGDSLSILTALDFTPKETTILTKGFEQLGLSKFGPTGPLIASGAIGGLQSGEVNVAFGGQLPGFKFPEKVGGVINPVALLVEPLGVSFFVDLTGGVQSKAEAGLRGDIRINLPRVDDINKRDSQDLTGKIFLTGTATGDLGIYANASKSGAWPDPMGLNKNISLNDGAVSLGIVASSATASVSVSVGLGGKMAFKILDKDKKLQTLKYDAAIGVNAGVSAACPPCIIPTAFGMSLGADKISADTAVRVADAVFDGMLKSGLVNVVLEGDAGGNNPLAPGLPNGPMKDGIIAFRDGLANQSLPELLLLDQIPLPGIVLTPPTGEKDVRFYIATPGAMLPGTEDTMEGLGFAIKGAASIDLLGENYKVGETVLQLSASDGFRVYGQVEPITIGALQLGSKPSENNPAGGTAVDVKAGLSEPSYYMLDTHVALGPVFEGTTKIKMATDETSFYLKRALGPQDDPLFNVELDVNASAKTLPPKFTVNAKIDNGINKVVEGVFTTLGMPEPTVNSILAVNPLVVESFSLKSDIAGFATGTGDPIEVRIQPLYFNDRPNSKLIEANVKAIDWANPANILLNSQELPNAILGSMIDYMILSGKHIDIKGFNLGGALVLKDGTFGGAKRPYKSFESYEAHMDVQHMPKLTKAKWKTEMPQEGVFKLITGGTILGTESDINVEITPRDIGFTSMVSLSGGALKTKITALGPIKDKIVTDLKFRGEFTSGIDKFVTETLMPGLGIPDPVIQGLEEAIPLKLQKVAFSGGLRGIVECDSEVKGDCEVKVHLEPVFFGDTGYASKKRETKGDYAQDRQERKNEVAHTLTVSIPSLDIANPAASLLTGTEVIDALTVAMIEYLIDNPQKTPGLDLGLVSFDAGALGGAKAGRSSVTLKPSNTIIGQTVNEKGRKEGVFANKEKVFVISGGMGLGPDGARTKAHGDMVFGRDKLTLDFTHAVLDGAFTSQFRANGAITGGKPQNLKYNAEVTNDLNAWLQGAVTKTLGSNVLSKEIAKAISGANVLEVKKASFSGDDLGKFLNRQAAADVNLEVNVKVNGKTKKVYGTIPVYVTGVHEGSPAGVAKLAGKITAIYAEALLPGSLKAVAEVATVVADTAKKETQKAVNTVASGLKYGSGAAKDAIKNAQKAVSKALGIFGNKKNLATVPKGNEPYVMLIRESDGKCLQVAGLISKPVNCDPKQENQHWQVQAMFRDGDGLWKGLRARVGNLCIKAWKPHPNNNMGGENWKTGMKRCISDGAEGDRYLLGLRELKEPSRHGPYKKYSFQIRKWRSGRGSYSLRLLDRQMGHAPTVYTGGLKDMQFSLVSPATFLMTDPAWTRMRGNYGSDIAVGQPGQVVHANVSGKTFHPLTSSGSGLGWSTIRATVNRIDVAPNGDYWYTDMANAIYRMSGLTGKVENMPGKAIDIGVGPGGKVWIMGTNKVPYHWTGDKWQEVHNQGNGTRIDVDGKGNGWIVGNKGQVYMFDLKTGWKKIGDNPPAIDIGVGGSERKPVVMILGTDGAPYHWNGKTWDRWGGGGFENISVDQNGSAWVLNSKDTVAMSGVEFGKK